MSLAGIFIFTIALTTGGCKKAENSEEENWTAPYSPSFLAQGVKYTSSGYSYLYFDVKCTSDAVEISSIGVTGPYGSSSYNGGGQTFSQNQSIYVYDEDHFMYRDGKYTFTINGIIRSGSNSGSTLTKITSWELIIP